MSTALATLAPAQIQSPVRCGTGIGLQTLEGCVSAFFALEGYDRRRGVATYALRVVNRTPSALICRTWIVSRTGDAVLAHPILVEVAPLSTSVAQVPVWPADFASFDRAIAEVAGEGVHCIVEAPAPQLVSGRRALALLAAATLAAAFTIAVAALGLRAAIPRISAFAVPPETLAGTTIRAEYDAAGAGRLNYTLLAPDGRRLAGAELSAGSGSIPIAIPAASEAGGYTLQLAMIGPFGAVSQTRVINALATRASGLARIEAISVKPPVTKPGGTVTVAYLANADGGYVRLLGSDGTIWQQRPFSRNGATQLAVPPVQSLHDLRVLIHVTKGRSVAQSMAGLAVISDSALPNAQIAQVVGDDDPNQAAAQSSDANGTFEVLERTVKSGGDIHVRIISPRNGMRIVLTDAQSREITGVDVVAEATTVTLRAPAVTSPARYTVVASFTDGFGQESVVQPVTVTP